MFKSTLAAGTLALFTLVSGAVPAFAAPASLNTSSTVVQPTAVAVLGALSPQAIDALKFMREEEKLAHDVYVTLYSQWGLRAFNNIAASEQKHTAAIARLLSTYNLSDPVSGNAPGEFANPDLQALYDQLTAQGSASVVEALKVGAAIEEIDILDLKAHMAETTNANILRVYGNLLSGSENHLRAFTSVLENQTGDAYTPQYMDQGAYDGIVSGGNNGQQGQGSRGGNGRRP